MPAAKAILNELLDGPQIDVLDIDERILTRAFCSPTVTIQDMRNERLDSPILVRMGFRSCADCEQCRNGVKIHNTDE